MPYSVKYGGVALTTSNKKKDMSQEEKNTQPEEETKTPEIVETTEETTPEVEEIVEETKPTEPTIGEQIGSKEKKSTKPDTVPFEVFERTKNDLKELKAEVKRLNEERSTQGNKSLSDQDLQSLADKYQVDEQFIADLTKTIQSKTSATFAEKLEKLEAKQQAEEIEKAFQKGFNDAIETMPAYKDIVVPEVIKELSLKPENQNKTFAQLIEDTYGKAVQGKETIETTTPRGGQEPQKLDMEKAQKDPDYFKNVVMKNPEMLAEYNKDLEKRINF